MTIVTSKKMPVSPSDGLFTVAGVMRRIRVEAALRSDAADRAALATYSADPFSPPNWGSSESQLAAKPQYELEELLRASDVDFVHNAYRAVLRRPADAIGLEGFVNQLRSGGMSKVDVLAELRWSDEGRTRGVHVNGLLLPHLLRKWGRKPVVGRLLRWTHALLFVHHFEPALAQSENILARDVQELGRHVGRLGDQFGGLLERHEDTLAIFNEQLGRVRETTSDMASANSRRVANLESQVAALHRVVEEQQHAFDEQSRRWERHLAYLDREMEAHRLVQERSGVLDTLYARFEDEFRGPKETIRARLMPYVSSLQAMGKGSEDQPILDLGAGRGEWLNLLRDAGLVASGVDTNRAFVAECVASGLNVVLGDAIAHLESLPESSLGAITTMHLVEHLPFEAVVALADACLRALKPGGVLIVETPNPENLRVATHNFYLDPTHRNPLPPIMMQWLFGDRGFSDVEILRLSDHRPLPVLPRLPLEAPAAASLNPLLDWAEIAPDYAIVARKPNE